MDLNEAVDSKIDTVERDSTKLPKGVIARVRRTICEIGKRNANNRVYSKALWERVLNDETFKRKLERRQILGALEHPEESGLKLDQNISHVVSNIFIDEATNTVKTEFDLLPTDAGKFINVLHEAGVQVGASTRADGELKEDIDEAGQKFYKVVPEAYKFITIDHTGDPSCFNTEPEKIISAVQSRYESKELNKAMAMALLEKVNTAHARELEKVINDDRQHAGCGCTLTEKKCKGGCKKVLVHPLDEGTTVLYEDRPVTIVHIFPRTKKYIVKMAEGTKSVTYDDVTEYVERQKTAKEKICEAYPQSPKIFTFLTDHWKEFLNKTDVIQQLKKLFGIEDDLATEYFNIAQDELGKLDAVMAEGKAKGLLEKRLSDMTAEDISVEIETLKKEKQTKFNTDKMLGDFVDAAIGELEAELRKRENKDEAKDDKDDAEEDEGWLEKVVLGELGEDHTVKAEDVDRVKAYLSKAFTLDPVVASEYVESIIAKNKVVVMSESTVKEYAHNERTYAKYVEFSLGELHVITKVRVTMYSEPDTNYSEIKSYDVQSARVWDKSGKDLEVTDELMAKIEKHVGDNVDDLLTECILKEKVTVVAWTNDSLTFLVDAKKYQYNGVTPPMTETFKTKAKQGDGYRAIHWLNKQVAKENRFRIEDGKLVPLAETLVEMIKVLADVKDKEGKVVGSVATIEGGETLLDKEKPYFFTAEESQYIELEDKAEGKSVDEVGGILAKANLTVVPVVKEDIEPSDKKEEEYKDAKDVGKGQNATPTEVGDKSDDVKKEEEKEGKENMIELAVVKAERDKTLEAIKALEERVKTLSENYTKDVEALNTQVNTLVQEKLQALKAADTAQAALKEVDTLNAQTKKQLEEAKKKEVMGIKEAVEKVMATLKANFEKVSIKKEKALKEQVTKVQEEYKAKLLKHYKDFKVQAIGLKLPTQVQALLESCKSEAEVDSCLEQAKDVIRESVLHLGTVSEVTVDVNKAVKTPQQQKLESHIADAFHAMGK